MSFGGDPGRDDGGLPPVNIEIPDDARELERDVLAYHRELRARRRRQRLRRVLAPFTGHGTALPLIATCVAISMLAGAMLSVVSITPASAPTVSRTPPAPARSAAPSPGSTPRAGDAGGAGSPGSAGSLPAGTGRLPAGTVLLDGRQEPVRHLVSSVLALVPARCGCGAALRRLAAQAAGAHIPVFFVGTGAAAPQLAALTTRYGGGTARPVYDAADVLGSAYHPVGLTVLLVHSDAVAEVRRNLPPAFQLAPVLPGLLWPASEPVSATASPVHT